MCTVARTSTPFGPAWLRCRAATNSSGNVYVTDSSNSRVQRFTATGGSPLAFGSLGTGNGQFLAASALGVATDSPARTMDPELREALTVGRPIAFRDPQRLDEPEFRAVG